MKLWTTLIFIMIFLQNSSIYATRIKPSLPNQFSDPIFGQAQFERESGTGQYFTCDWIVSHGDIYNGSDSVLVFADVLTSTYGIIKGDATAFRSSTYFYFYQLENLTSNYATSLTVNVNPASVITAGFINSADCDLDSDNLNSFSSRHVIPFEQEVISDIKCSITFAVFDPSGLTPNQSLSFIPTGLFPNRESFTFFITSNQAPVYKSASVLAGSPAYADELPVPNATFDEPSTILLVSYMIGGLLLRKKLLVTLKKKFNF